MVHCKSATRKGAHVIIRQEANKHINKQSYIWGFGEAYLASRGNLGSQAPAPGAVRASPACLPPRARGGT